MDFDLSDYIDLWLKANEQQRRALADEIERELGFERPTADDIMERLCNSAATQPIYGKPLFEGAAEVLRRCTEPRCQKGVLIAPVRNGEIDGGE